MKAEPYVVIDSIAIPTRCLAALDEIVPVTYEYKDGNYHYSIRSAKTSMVYLSKDDMAAIIAADKLK